VFNQAFASVIVQSHKHVIFFNEEGSEWNFNWKKLENGLESVHAVGVATFIGVFLEEITHLTATFAVFVQAGAPIWKAMALNAFGATPFIIGASIILIVLAVPSANQNDVSYLVPFACGSFLYVTLADLVPIVSMYWHGWVRAFSHMSAVGTGLLLQASIRVYDTVSGSQD